MNENVKTYYPLGAKTLFMIILKRGGILIAFLLMLFVGLFFIDYIPGEYLDIAVTIIFAYVVVFVVIALIVLFFAWLEYSRYWIFIGEKSFKIKRGLISTEEIGIPYKHIRDVKIKRSLLDQILGMSDIVVVLSDFGDNDPVTQDSLIFLPSLEKGIAIEIRDHITRRSQVEQIHMLPSQKAI